MTFIHKPMHRNSYYVIPKQIAREYNARFQEQIAFGKMFGKIENAMAAFSPDDSHILIVNMPEMLIPEVTE